MVRRGQVGFGGTGPGQAWFGLVWCGVLSRATQFTVFGLPATKGSSVSFLGKDGRVVTKADCASLAAWSQAVGWAARAARVPMLDRETPVEIRAEFQFVRPNRSKRLVPTVRPDLDKVTRALLDALTGVAFVDDAQVVAIHVAKRYSDAARTDVTVEPIEGAAI